MARIMINSEDTYEVVKSSILTDYDRKVLIRLYQPIVGYGAISLYFSLLSELEADKTTTSTTRPHSVIFDMMNCSNTEFLLFITKLEGVGLVKTYVKEEDEITKYIYSLLAPKTPKEFFDYDLLVSLLQEKISKKDFDRTRMYFKDDSKISKGYAEVTSVFNDIFDTENLEAVSVKNNLVGVKSAYPEIQFNFDAFYLKLRDFQFDKRKIDKIASDTIANLSVTYGLSAYEMAGLVVRCLDNVGLIDIDRLKSLARRSSSLVKREEKTVQPMYSGNEKLDEKIRLMNSVDPLEYFKLISPNQILLPREADIIQKYISLSNLPHGVINALLDFCVQKGDVISSNLLQYWGRKLMNENIRDTYQAMEVLQNALSLKPKQTRKKEEDKPKNVVVEETPSVVEDDEYNKKLQAYLEKRKTYAKD